MVERTDSFILFSEELEMCPTIAETKEKQDQDQNDDDDDDDAELSSSITSLFESSLSSIFGGSTAATSAQVDENDLSIHDDLFGDSFHGCTGSPRRQRRKRRLGSNKGGFAPLMDYLCLPFEQHHVQESNDDDNDDYRQEAVQIEVWKTQAACEDSFEFRQLQKELRKGGLMTTSASVMQLLSSRTQARLQSFHESSIVHH